MSNDIKALIVGSEHEGYEALFNSYQQYSVNTEVEECDLVLFTGGSDIAKSSHRTEKEKEIINIAK